METDFYPPSFPHHSSVLTSPSSCPISSNKKRNPSSSERSSERRIHPTYPLAPPIPINGLDATRRAHVVNGGAPRPRLDSWPAPLILVLSSSFLSSLPTRASQNHLRTWNEAGHPRGGEGPGRPVGDDPGSGPRDSTLHTQEYLGIWISSCTTVECGQGNVQSSVQLGEKGKGSGVSDLGGGEVFFFFQHWEFSRGLWFLLLNRIMSDSLGG